MKHIIMLMSVINSAHAAQPCLESAARLAGEDIEICRDGSWQSNHCTLTSGSALSCGKTAVANAAPCNTVRVAGQTLVLCSNSVALLNDGAAGETGSKGSPGDAGPTGSAGPQGPKGFKGVPGPIGFQGSAGPTGLPGIAGGAGPVGARGSKGPTGAQGAAGQPGVTGFQGPQGPQGPMGPEGPRGPQGAANFMGSPLGGPLEVQHPCNNN